MRLSKGEHPLKSLFFRHFLAPFLLFSLLMACERGIPPVPPGAEGPPPGGPPPSAPEPQETMPVITPRSIEKNGLDLNTQKRLIQALSGQTDEALSLNVENLKISFQDGKWILEGTVESQLVKDKIDTVVQQILKDQEYQLNISVKSSS